MRDIRIAVYLSIALYFVRNICNRCTGTKCNYRHYGHVVYGDSSKPIRMPPDSAITQMLYSELQKNISNYMENAINAKK